MEETTGRQAEQIELERAKIVCGERRRRRTRRHKARRQAGGVRSGEEDRVGGGRRKKDGAERKLRYRVNGEALEKLSSPNTTAIMVEVAYMVHRC